MSGELFTGRLGAGTSSLGVLLRHLPAAEAPNAQFSPLKTRYLLFMRPETPDLSRATDTR